jgi:hypothetical protein
MEGKKLYDLFIQLGPMLPKILDMEDNVLIWATDKEKYTFMITPKTSEWSVLNIKEGDYIRAGQVGPVVMKTKKAAHATIPADVFGLPIRASAYPIIENGEVLGVVGISFGVNTEKDISEVAANLSNMCAKLYYGR